MRLIRRERGCIWREALHSLLLAPFVFGALYVLVWPEIEARRQRDNVEVVE